MISLLSRLKAKACQCELAATCECGKPVDCTDRIILYMLVAGLRELETQEDLLSLDNLTLEAAESEAFVMEAAKFSQSEIVKK